MTKQTQIEWARKELLTTGRVTRNQALKKYISRLGAIIWWLKKDGMQIEGRYNKNRYGLDYEYILLKK